MNKASEFAGVSTTAHYNWAANRDQPTARAIDDAALLEVIREVHANSGGTYGEPLSTVTQPEDRSTDSTGRGTHIPRDHVPPSPSVERAS